MNQDVLSHIDHSLNEIRNLFMKAATRIEAIKPGEKIPATTLAADLAKEIGMTGPTLYPTLLFLFNDYPGVKRKKGAQGGLERIAVAAVATPTIVPTGNDTICNDLTQE